MTGESENARAIQDVNFRVRGERPEPDCQIPKAVQLKTCLVCVFVRNGEMGGNAVHLNCLQPLKSL